MYTKTRILSTKKLSFTQRELLLNASFSLIEFDAITIQPLPFESKKEIGNAIIASKNAVRQVLEANIDMNQCFCVGEKTSRLLVENHKKVVKTTENALELAHFIAKNYKNDEFTFFCGNKRRDELPDFLKENNIALDEIPVYKTELNPKKIEGEFDGIFFFSPSAIQSYIQENTIGNSIAFCIGNTTAKEAKKYTKNIIITNKPTIENTIVQAVKHFKND
ncbi:MAG: uroporphyrinogen-III synthase [Flavobacteriaceae bacterium]|nr:uroporphyrinogen-III synthase [Flavobacteriaceae bacterium]